MTKTDRIINSIYMHLLEKYGPDQAERDIYPLAWYINSGRANAAFINKLDEVKPFMIARRLHKGGSVEQQIDRVCSFLE